jgi:hypothetical protein
MALEGGATIGVWSDLEGPEVRAALRALGSEKLPVRYLDGAGIPMRYKLRRVKGEPAPMSVLAEMERQQAAPWEVRDRMLIEMAWNEVGKSINQNRIYGLETNYGLGRRGGNEPAKLPDSKPLTVGFR